jgi:hypothetical protein
MHKTTALAATIAFSACSPAASVGPTVEPSNSNDATAAPQLGSRPHATPRGTQMLPIEVLITSGRGQVRAELADNEAARALAEMLPLEIAMRDHLRQKKTGDLPSPLPGGERQTGFSVGTLGLWGDRDFVIYYREGRVPAPGIVVLGLVRGDLSMLDNPSPVTIILRRAG